MRVAHICNLPIPPDHPDYGKLWNHPGRWVLNLALAQKQHAAMDPFLVVQVPGSTVDFQTEIEGIPVLFLRAPTRLRAATLFHFDTRRISAAVRRLHPDMVHAHGTEDAYGLAAQHTGLPHVLTVQGAFFLINRILKPRLLSRARIVGFTESICLRRERHVIAKSDYVGAALHQQFPHLTIHRIPNTIDPRLEEVTGKKQTNTLVFVGAVDHRKGLDIILRATEIVQRFLPGIVLWVVGDSGGKAGPYEIEVVAQLRALMGERLVLHGAVSNLAAAKKIAEANVLLAPSREEMFGNQVIEALVMGTHAIVTEQTAMAENVRRYGNGTVVPQEDPESLADAIMKSLNRADEGTLAGEARRAVLTDLAPNQVAKKHADVYQSIRR